MRWRFDEAEWPGVGVRDHCGAVGFFGFFPSTEAKTMCKIWGCRVGAVLSLMAYLLFYMQTGVAQTTESDFTLSLSSSSIELNRGGQKVRVNIGLKADPSITVQARVDVLPSGVNGSIIANLYSAGGTLILSANDKAQIGQTKVWLTGRETAGPHIGQTQSVPFVVSVVSNPDFSVSVSPSIFSLRAGGTATTKISIGRINGFSDIPKLSLIGDLPTGVTAKVNPTSNDTADLIFTAENTIKNNGGAFYVVGTAGKLSRSADIYLQIIDTPPVPTFFINRSVSGSWYDPAQSGHGFLVQALPDRQLMVYWFAYTPDGSAQSWVSAVGPYNPSSNTVTLPVVLTAGGRFPPNFDPSKVKRTPWGTITLTFLDCNSATAAWDSTVGNYGSGSMTLTRLSSVDGLICTK